MKFAFIAVEKASTPVTVLCKVLEVSRSGYYAWEHRVPSARCEEDAKLRVHIAAIHERSRGLYGSPRVHAELRESGFQVSRKRVARLMGELGLESRRKRRFKATTDSSLALPVAENVLEATWLRDGQVRPLPSPLGHIAGRPGIRAKEQAAVDECLRKLVTTTAPQPI